MTPPLVRLSGVVRRFGSVTALDGAELRLLPGEVHGVLGENGAGKTTLLHILGGLLRPDAGTVELEGEPRSFSSPREAWAAGVGLVHQHFTLVPTLTVLENLALGLRSSGGAVGEGLRSRIDALVERTGLEIPLGARVEELGVGTRQRIEILKALLRRPRILVLDEPTAVLAPLEVERLFGLLRELAAGGDAVALVAHKLDEVLAVADRVTVLRRGRTVLEAPRDDVDGPALVRAMVDMEEVDAVAVGWREGEGGGEATGPRRRPGGPVVARLEEVTRRGPRGEVALDRVSLEVRRGEVVGVAGVEGNGQRELARVLAGRAVPDSGRTVLPDEVAFIPQDRTREGLVAGFDLADNVALTLQRRSGYRVGPLVRWGAVRERTTALMDRFDVRAPGPDALASALSGGNQQRMVVARELEVADELVVAENPTRGLDVKAAAFVHRELQELAAGEDGPGVVLVSTDLDEVLALAHRVLVMVRGRLLAVEGAGEGTAPDREEVGRLMLSGTGERDAPDDGGPGA